MTSTRRKPLIAFLWMTHLFALLVFLDQWSKAWAVEALKDKPALPLIPDVLELQYLENTGAAFGLLKDARSFFLISTVMVLVIILSVLTRMPLGKRHFPLRLLLIIIAAGAVGNLIDRVQLHYVRDFIYFKPINFPIFNVADICVSCATIVLIILLMAVYKDKDLAFLSRETAQAKDASSGNKTENVSAQEAAWAGEKLASDGTTAEKAPASENAAAEEASD